MVRNVRRYRGAAHTPLNWSFFPARRPDHSTFIASGNAIQRPISLTDNPS
jgi:hypothetical protein